MERNSLSHSLKDHSIGYNKGIKDNTSSININHFNGNSNSYKLNDSTWSMSSSGSSTNNQGFGEHQQDYLAGFSWPPRSYTCSFCKREFRSAQALGGHMNVHRRDRARLRQSPPTQLQPQAQAQALAQPPFLNLNLNPNPNPTLFPSLLVSPPFSSNLPSSSPSPAFPTHHHEMKKWRVNGALNVDPLNPKGGSDSTKTMKGSSTNANAKSFFGVKEFKDYGACKKLVMKKSSKSTEYVRLDLDLEIGLVTDSNQDLDLELRLGYS